MFLHPLGLLALLGLPVVVAIHLFRRRFRPREVSALFLWRDDDDVPLAGRRRERLRTGASFWLELLAALLLALAFAGPRACGAGEADHLVVVLDASASMDAELYGERLSETAVELVRDRIDDLSSRGRVTIVESGPRPTLLAGPAAFAAEASARLDGYEPSAARHDLSPAVALALQLAGGAAVLVVTDHYAPGQFPDEVELVSIGRPGSNVAITHAARTRVEEEDGTVERALVTLTAFTREPVRTELLLRAEDGGTQRRSVELAPDEREHLTFDLADGVGAVELALAPDALAIDDRVVLAPVPPRTLALGTTLDPVELTALGLGSEGSPTPLDRWLAIVPESLEAPSPDLAHLRIARRPATSPRTWGLALAAQGEEREDLIGPFLAEKHHPALEGLTLQGIVWSVDPNLRLPGTPLVSAGDTPILTEDLRGDRRTWWMNVDPWRSSLQRSPDWPILLSNLAELRRAELPGPVRTNVSVGDRFVYRASDEAVYLVRAVDGDWEREYPARGTLVAEDIERPGLYTLSRDGRELCRFGVGFKDPAESDLRGMRPGDNSRDLALARIRAGMNPVQMGAIVGVLVALLLDWWVLARSRRRLRFSLGEGGA